MKNTLAHIQKTNTQSGSILVYVLLAVVLFAALSYAVSQMMRGGTNSVGAEKHAILMDGTLSYARNVKQAIQAIRISNSCAESEVSFEGSPFDGSDTDYVNASAPIDFSCHVFHPQGGGLGKENPDSEVSSNEYIFTGELGVTGLGSDSNSELSMVLRGLTLAQCAIINEKIGLEAPQTDSSSSANFFTDAFTGSYALSGDLGTGIGTGNAVYDGRSAGCFHENNVTSGEYFFYQVLWPR